MFSRRFSPEIGFLMRFFGLFFCLFFVNTAAVFHVKQFVFHFLCFLAFLCDFFHFFMSKKFLYYNKKCAILDVATQPAKRIFGKEEKAPLTGLIIL